MTTMENEKTQLVSDDELIKDIKLTASELEAYIKLTQGYDTLSILPENLSYRRKYQLKSHEYADSMYKCRKFLDQLQALADERGLTWHE